MEIKTSFHGILFLFGEQFDYLKTSKLTSVTCLHFQLNNAFPQINFTAVLYTRLYGGVAGWLAGWITPAARSVNKCDQFSSSAQPALSSPQWAVNQLSGILKWSLWSHTHSWAVWSRTHSQGETRGVPTRSPDGGVEGSEFSSDCCDVCVCVVMTAGMLCVVTGLWWMGNSVMCFRPKPYLK